MIVCYQWWFTPKDAFNEGISVESKSLHSKRKPEEAGEYNWGTYHEVSVIWKIKQIRSCQSTY